MRLPAPDTPRYVLTTTTHATTVLRTLQRQGWRIREGFALPETTWDQHPHHLVLYGRVNDTDTAQLALLAAIRHAGVVIITDTTTPTGRALLADLTRIGPVHTTPEPPTNPSTTPLAPEQQALLRRLANGETIASAAAAEYLSLRTANRRIADARKTLGVRTTREAVLAYIRHHHTH